MVTTDLDADVCSISFRRARFRGVATRM